MKKVVSVILSVCLFVSLFSSVVYAQMNVTTSDTWSINYYPGAPASVSNQADWATTGVYSGDYQASCSSYSGFNGAGIRIDIVNGDLVASNGLSYVLMSSTGVSYSWHLNFINYSYGATVNTRLEAYYGYQLVANGSVYFVNN